MHNYGSCQGKGEGQGLIESLDAMVDGRGSFVVVIQVKGSLGKLPLTNSLSDKTNVKHYRNA
jgi:hypothetical protein